MMKEEDNALEEKEINGGLKLLVKLRQGMTIIFVDFDFFVEFLHIISQLLRKNFPGFLVCP